MQSLLAQLSKKWTAHLFKDEWCLLVKPDAQKMCVWFIKLLSSFYSCQPGSSVHQPANGLKLWVHIFFPPTFVFRSPLNWKLNHSSSSADQQQVLMLLMSEFKWTVFFFKWTKAQQPHLDPCTELRGQQRQVSSLKRTKRNWGEKDNRRLG